MQHFFFLSTWGFSLLLSFIASSLHLRLLPSSSPPQTLVCGGRLHRWGQVGLSVGPPHRLIHAAGGAHGRGRVAVAAVGLHAVALVVEARVHQAVGPRGPGAGEQAGGGALAPAVPGGHHGELVGAGSRAVVQVGVGLEVLGLVAGVGRGQVGVVPGRGRHAETPDAGAGGVGGVGEGPRVVHAGVREAGVGQRGQGGEGGPLVEEVCGTCRRTQRGGDKEEPLTS